MSDPALFRYRVTYSKTGRLAMLSHLEVAHALERIVRRAELPFAVTQGFSPHMKIGFGSALPVGVGSTCEYMDLFLTSYVPAEQAFQALQAAAPADLMVTKVVSVGPQEPAATVAFPYSVYRCLLQRPEGFSTAPKLTVPEQIQVDREGKVKVYRVDDYLVNGISTGLTPEGLLAATFTLRVQQNGALRPDLLIRKTMEATGLDAQVVEVTRIKQNRTI